MNHNFSFCFLFLYLPFCTLIFQVFWSKITNPSRQTNTATENRKFCNRFCCWQNKIFYKLGSVYWRKLQLVLLLKVVPLNPCKMQIKFPLVVPSLGLCLRSLDPMGSGHKVRTCYIDLTTVYCESSRALICITCDPKSPKFSVWREKRKEALY